jgi:hypothetical protein
MTLGTKTLAITTLSIRGLFVTLSINGTKDKLHGVGQNGQNSFLKNGMEDCGYMVCGSKKFFDPFVNYEPNIQHTL